MIKCYNFSNHFLSFIFSLFFISQYINSIIIFYLNINFTFIITFVVFMIFVLELIKSVFIINFKKHKYNKYIILIVFTMIYLSVIYFLYAYFYHGMKKFYKVIPFLFTLPIAYILVKRNILVLFIKYIIINSIIFLILVFSDINLVIHSIMTASRGLYIISPLNISSLSLIVSLLSIGLYFQYRFKIYQFLFILFFILSFIGGSKGPLVSYFISLIIMFFLYYKNKFKFFIKIFSLSILNLIIIIVLSINNIKIVDRFLGLNYSNNQTSINSREILYKYTLSSFNKDYLFGRGVDTFRFEGDYYKYPHNIYLELCYEIGIFPSMLIFFSLFLIGIKLKFYKRNIIYFSLLTYLIFESMFSHNLTFLRNILWIYFVLLFLYNKNYKLQRRILYEKNILYK